MGGAMCPPSRHHWVGNLPHDIPEIALTSHFLQFGELESVAFQPGRSYAFINFKNDQEAFAAVRALQGFVIAGNPLKIEFAKAVSLVPPPFIFLAIQCCCCYLYSCTLTLHVNSSISLNEIIAA